MVMAHSIGRGSSETATVNNPKPGKWKALIDPFSVPSGRTTCAYMDVFTNPVFGSLSSTAGDSSHPKHAKWTEEIESRVERRPAGGRHLIRVFHINADGVNSVDYRINEPTIVKPVDISRNLN